jgi:hypothetical protein
MQFELSLPPTDGSSTRRMTTLHLMLAVMLSGMGAGCFALYWFTSVSPTFTHAFTPFLVFGACSMLAGVAIAVTSIFNKQWLMHGRRSVMLRIAETAVLAIGCAVFAYAGQKLPAVIFGVVAIVIAVAAVWESRKPTEHKVAISDKGITLPRKGSMQTLKWLEVEGVLLRHGIITIELTGNRLIQHEVLSEGTDVERLEDYSKQQIEQHAEQRAAHAAW